MDVQSVLLGLSVALFVGVSFAWLRIIRRRPGPDAFVIVQLERAGANLSRPHPVEFFLYFPERDGADRAAAKVAALGMEVKVDRAASGSLWLVFAVRNMVPAEREMARLRVALEAIAAAEKGEYDGWGAPVVK